MAVDETLMHHVRRTGDHVMRVYAWQTPTLSFGRNQTVHGRYNRQRIDASGVACVRRPTGGRAVLHHREITYAVVAPVSGLGSLRSSYERINALLLAALEAIGVRAVVAKGERSEVAREMSYAPTPCFDLPSRGELVHSDRKLVGSAQWRDRDVLLQHGSILTGDDQSLIHDFLVDKSSTVREPATLGALLGREPDLSEVGEALEAAVREVEDGNASPIDIDELRDAELQAALERYRDTSWTWSR